MPLEAVLTNLKKFTRYRIVVQAYNRIGAGPRNEDLIISTAEDGKVAHDSSYNWFMDHIYIYIYIGLSLLLYLLAILC